MTDASAITPESALDDYLAFLNAKVKVAEQRGFDVPADQVNPSLSPHIRAIVPWMLAGGRRAFFGRFGTRKTSAQLECMRHVGRHAVAPASAGPDGVAAPTLIIVPLGARRGFFQDAERYFTGAHAVRLKFIQSDGAIEPGCIHLTNPESIRERKVDPRRFAGVSWDEADVLRGFGGTETFRVAMEVFGEVPYRFVATATPDPNEYIELLAYAAFLGIMDVGEAKTRFFKRDSTKADKLTVHPHKEAEFWLWVSSWALFLQKPSDLGPEYSDDGYELPPLDVRWHEVKSDHATAGADRDGQGLLFRNAAIGVTEAAREKRDSLAARVARMMEIRAEMPEARRLIWHDLEAERDAIETAIPGIATVYGSQDLDQRERLASAFEDGQLRELAAKPVMLGAGNNFQYHCWWEIFLGIGHKFRDLIQAIHRVQRAGQAFDAFPGAERRVRVDLIYTEAEREVRRNLEAKWQRYEEQAARMSGIIREYGLAQASIAGALQRSMGVQRQEASGGHLLLADGSTSNWPQWTAINNDCVDETRRMTSDSVDLIVTSIPFSTQYEYSPSYNDFGHTDDSAHFWRQMDFLIPELLRVLRPGRMACIHVKDRIVPGGINGLGCQTVDPFSDQAIAAFRRHGFAFMARITVVTDVVRENNQTYRLGWTRQCEDATVMGCGLPEYVILLRKPPTDRTRSYADVPVVKSKPLCDDHGVPAPFDKETNWKQPVPGTGYSRARWQFDAAGFQRSSGDRLLTSDELRSLTHKELYRAWRARSTAAPYDFAQHVATAEDLDHLQRLPSTFALLPVHSWHPQVWTDIARMRTLNGEQHAKGKEQHLCPLQFDIVDRLVERLSMPGETVLDPFGGLMTVPYRCIALGRRGIGIELSPQYWRDGVYWCERMERGQHAVTLLDVMEAKAAGEGEDDEASAEAVPSEAAE